ncbi:carboxymuconolactone decarboxylase family protein [Scytonema sp. NUACC26]|uniref:carboxymuconolactone decarboxylase family protein n=1 Tax=Scytonema sp. NUACC26 TaxID=3140176 RepID=UPI0034DBEA46
MSASNKLPADLAAFQNSYAELFGSVPPLPAAKFEFIGDIDPEALRLAEQLRAHAFYSDIFDTKTTQLMLFGMLLVLGAGAARFHAIAARRTGATWEELHKVAELASAVVALGPLNNGSAILNELRTDEAKGK